MDNLPPEVLHLICKNLSSEDAANTRLVNRALSHTASYYLVDTVRFNTSQDSFERLKLLSDHPIFHQTINTVVYEASTIGEIGGQHAYLEHFVEGSHHMFDRPRRPRFMASDREKRLFKRNMRKFHRNVSNQWERYVDKHSKQQKLLNETQLNSFIGQAMAKFIHVREVVFSPFNRCQHTTSKRFLEEFGPTGTIPMSANPASTAEQLEPLLLPRGHGSRAVRKVDIGCITPRFFTQESRRSALTELFAQLTDINLVLKLYPDDANIEHLVDTSATLDDLLKDSILKDCLAAARSLRALSIGIRGPGICNVDGTQVLFGDNIWPQLEKLSLESLRMTQHAFLGLLTRHRSLSGLHLMFMEIREGSWIETLFTMRTELNLPEFVAWGYLLDGDDCYGLDFLEIDAYHDDIERSLSDAIQDYVCGPNHPVYDEQFENPLFYFHEEYEDPDFLRDGPDLLIASDEDLARHPSDIMRDLLGLGDSDIGDSDFDDLNE